VVVGVDAELDESSVDDVSQTEDVIISQWRELSTNEKHQYRGRVDEIFRPLGYETSLVVIRRANSIAMFFACLTLSALTSLHGQWYKDELKDIVQSLCTFLSGASQTVRIKRLTWTQADYERQLGFFNSVQG